MSYYDRQGTPPALPPARRAAARKQLEQIVGRSARTRRWQRPGFAAVGGLVLLGTCAAAVAYVQYQPVTNRNDARCYTDARSAGGYYATIAAAGLPGSKEQVDRARSVCEDLWRQGFLRTGASGITRPENTSGSHRVPQLVVCTMADGSAAVFPGNQGTCAGLGLPVASQP